MASNGNRVATELIVRKGQRIVQVPDEENGEPITRVFVVDKNQPRRHVHDETLRSATSTIEPMTDLEWEEAEAELDRIRREGQPGWFPHPSVRARVARSLAGAWTDLDWDETVEALDRIRHESSPSTPEEP
jgi:hypothetical protein